MRYTDIVTSIAQSVDPHGLLQLVDANDFEELAAVSGIPKDRAARLLGHLRDVGASDIVRAGHEIWVSVLDTGPGFDQTPDSMVEFGKSTKSEHIGFGLGTAKQAMQAMEGDVYPANASEGGARVELRWFGSHEDSVH